MESVKQVILYRRDLNMRKGKIGAQIAHASMGTLLDRNLSKQRYLLEVDLDEVTAQWLESGYRKIVLTVENEEDLMRAYDEARQAELHVHLVTDLGFTEFNGVPTRTALAIGPAIDSKIDAITGPNGTVKTKLA